VVTSGQFVEKLMHNAVAVGVMMTVQSSSIAVPPSISTSDPSDSLDFADMVTPADTPEEDVVVQSIDNGRRISWILFLVLMLVVAIALSCGLGWLVLRKLAARRDKHMGVVGIDEVCVDGTSSDPLRTGSKTSTKHQSSTGKKVYVSSVATEEATEEAQEGAHEGAQEEAALGNRPGAKGLYCLPSASSLPYVQSRNNNPLAPTPAPTTASS
jgi:hypothetical protein